MEYLIFTLIIGFIAYITYKIIKNNATEYKHTTLEILKDTQNSLLKNKLVNKEFQYSDYVAICKKEKFIFGKLESSKLYISKGNYDDDDYDDWC